MRRQLNHACPVPVNRVVDDPDHDDRVIATIAGCGRVNLTIRSFLDTCRLAPGAQVLSTRLIEW